MEKKYEFTINSKILKNLFVSVLISILIVFVLNFMHYDGRNIGMFNSSDSFFGDSVFDCNNKFDFALEAITTDNERIAILIVSLIFWIISIIHHFVKFKIK